MLSCELIEKVVVISSKSNLFHNLSIGASTEFNKQKKQCVKRYYEA